MRFIVICSILIFSTISAYSNPFIGLRQPFFCQSPFTKLSKTSPHTNDLRQTKKSLSEIYKDAKEAEPFFVEKVEKTAKMFNATIDIAQLKKRHRTIEKAFREHDKDFSKVRDIVRGTLIFEKLEDIADAYHYYLNKHYVGNIKNYFLTPKETGYRSVQFSFVLPNGHVAELQFHLKDMYEAKKQSTPIYKRIREIESVGELNAKQKYELQMLKLEHKKIMDYAFEKYLDNNSSDIQDIFNRRNESP